MTSLKIQQIFKSGFSDFEQSQSYISEQQHKVAHAIINCKTGNLGHSVSICEDCGHTELHNNSCRNRHCPNCQAIVKELWVDKRRSEVIDTPYFHVVFTLPHELNSLIYCNQRVLYSMFHKCCAETLLELSQNPKYLGATPGIIQVLHTWNQELSYHIHMHCIISGGGLTTDQKLLRGKSKFFIPVFVLRDKFKGKFLAMLQDLWLKQTLTFSDACTNLQNTEQWKQFKDSLYNKDWCPYIKETFNGFGNAIEYLGKYTHKIAISNSRIVSFDEKSVVFSARGKKPGDSRRSVQLSRNEFIRRFLMHTLPSGFQKIRYYGFLNNRKKKQNLMLIFRLQGGQKFKARYINLNMSELLKQIFSTNICLCPACGKSNMKPAGRTFGKGG